MRNKFADTFYEMGKKDDRLAIVVADISPAGSIAAFRKEFPHRFVNTGVSEQIMIGMCAGMSMRGLRPFAYTIATFTLYRPFEFVRDDLCYQNLPVTIVGIGGGVAYCTLGATHHAMEDISVASSLPNMSVIAPCDPAEVAAATRWCALENERGPVYLRLGKAGEPDLTKDAIDSFQFGKIRYLRKGKSVCFLSYGVMVKQCVEMADILKNDHDLDSTIISCHTLKPLDVEGIKSLFTMYNHIIIVEDHVPQGGLGSQVKQLAWEHKAACSISHYSLKDEFIHKYGSLDNLYEAHGLDKTTILTRLPRCWYE